MTPTVDLRRRIDAMRDVRIMPDSILDDHATIDTSHRTTNVWETSLFRPCDAAISRLQEWCEIEDLDSIEAYIALFPILERVLIEAQEQIATVFGEARGVIRLDSAGSCDGLPRLFVEIKTALPAVEAVERLDVLDNGWWLDQPYDVRARMIPTLA